MRFHLVWVLASLPLAAQAPDPAADPLNKAYAAMRSDDLVGARAYLLDAQAAAPEDPRPRKELGYLYLKTKRLDAARSALEATLGLDSSDLAVALELAFLHSRLGAAAASQKLFEQVAAQGTVQQSEQARKALAAASTASDPTAPALEAGYAALRAGDFDRAASAFARAVAAAPGQARLYKELAYALLKTGETERARDAFARAVEIDPADEAAALELAFLEHDTGMHAESLTLLRRLAEAEEPRIRATALGAVERMEAELAGDIDRWERTVAAAPENRAGRLELARLYERAAEPANAAEQFQAAFALPGVNGDEILLTLGRMRKAAGDLEGAHGAWLLASRSEEVRIAETARGWMPPRYPYANEFRRALDLKPDHASLRKDLAYLLLEVGETESAVEEFQRTTEAAPNDMQAAAQLAYLYLGMDREDEAFGLLERARQSEDPDVVLRAEQTLTEVRARKAAPARAMGEKSLEKSYLRDARRQFYEAWRLNPQDHSVALKLGVVHNLLTEDREAVRWFRLASRSEDPAVAEQALRSYRALAPSQKKVLTTVWAFPFYSRRFSTVFGYAQAKTEFRFDSLPATPYVSLRVAGDTRRRSGGAAAPQLLSESSLIGAVGLRKRMDYGVTLWGEAGQSVSYLGERPDGVPFSAPDYRGGLNWFRAKGPTLGSDETGVFQEVNLDTVYISRFDHDVLSYFQYRPGYRLPTWRWVRAQTYLNWNVTVDRSRQYWGNYAEAGPGVRLRVPKINPPMNLSFDFVRGVHLSNRGNTRRPNYFDVRAGLWYSFSK